MTRPADAGHVGRHPLIAGNWKMNTTLPEAVELAGSAVREVGTVAYAQVVLCPPFISLAAVAEAVAGTNIAVGAQNAHWQAKGAYTGEVSPGMLAGLCRYVIAGHS